MTWHACLGEPQDEAGLESPWWPLSCSLIWCHWALLLLELQLWWCHLRSPKLKRTHPTGATGQDGWISVQLGCSWPTVPFSLLVVTGRAIGVAGSLAGTAGGVLGLVSDMEVCMVSVVPGCVAPLNLHFWCSVVRHCLFKDGRFTECSEKLCSLS